jgi:hypothetical protein
MVSAGGFLRADGVGARTFIVSAGTRTTSLRNNTQQAVAPRAGALPLFQGSKCWHCGEAVLNEPKVICLLNYYAGTSAMRPQELGFLIFGK